MKTLRIFLFSTCLALPSIIFAQTMPLAFTTPRDLITNDGYANISLQNNSSSDINVYGIYVRQFAHVLPGQNCDSAVTIYPSSTNLTIGSMVMPVVIKGGKRASVGKNYLYNMIFQANFYAVNSTPNGVCQLPGCTWGSDSTIYNWCIYLGALAPVSNTAGYTANVAPSTDAASSPGQYNYNLVTNYVTLGPISCNDQTLTCNVANQQTQPFS